MRPAAELDRVVLFSRVAKEMTARDATFKALLIKRDTGPLTYDLHVCLAANHLEARLLCDYFALVLAARVEARVFQHHLMIVRFIFLKQKVHVQIFASVPVGKFYRYKLNSRILIKMFRTRCFELPSDADLKQLQQLRLEFVSTPTNS